MAHTNGLERTQLLSPAATTHRPDPFSKDVVGTFFDFEAWDGFKYDDHEIDSMHGAGPSELRNLDLFVELDHRHDFAIPSETGNDSDWDVDRSLEQVQCFHQSSGDHSCMQAPGTQQPLASFAGEQLSDQHIGQKIPRLDHCNELACMNALGSFGHLCTGLDQQFLGPGSCPACVTSTIPSSSQGATSSAPGVKDLVPTPPAGPCSYVENQLHPNMPDNVIPHQSPQPETVYGSLPNMPEMFPRHERRISSNSDPSGPRVAIETPSAIPAETIFPPPTPMAPLKRGKKRTCISKATKKILDGHFRMNPYPTDVETSALESATRLTGRTIKTWFSNRRSRTRTVEMSFQQNQSATTQVIDLNAATPQNSIRPVSRANLDTLEHLSPAASMTSLERYLALPFSQEAMSSETLNSFRLGNNQERSRHSQDNFFSEMEQMTNSWLLRRRSIELLIDLPRATSVVGSVGSCGSLQSYVSLRSVDSRGSRRGRKAWVRRQQQATVSSMTDLRHANVSSQALPHARSLSSLHRPSRQRSIDAGDDVSVDGWTLCDQILMVTPDSMQTDDDPAAEASHAVAPPNDGNDDRSTRMETESRPLFCTWPTCDAKFRYRWEWARHEQAVHYQPYHWVCCPDNWIGSYFVLCFACDGAYHTFDEFKRKHSATCIGKDLADRTFYRKDQLIQHIQGTHQIPEISSLEGRAFISRWEAPNPLSDPSALKCGFCGDVFATWKERQDHVYRHVQGGTPKHLWTVRPGPVP